MQSAARSRLARWAPYFLAPRGEPPKDFGRGKSDAGEQFNYVLSQIFYHENNGPVTSRELDRDSTLGAKAGCTLITNGTFRCRLAAAHVLEFILASTLPGFLQLFDASFPGLLKCMTCLAAVRSPASDATAILVSSARCAPCQPSGWAHHESGLAGGGTLSPGGTRADRLSLDLG